MRFRDLNSIVQKLGCPGTLVAANGPNTPEVHYTLPKVLTQSTAKAQESIVNQYGVSGREFVILAKDLPAGYKLKKYDSVQCAAGNFVLVDPMPLIEEGTGNVMAWRAYAKGK